MKNVKVTFLCYGKCIGFNLSWHRGYFNFYHNIHVIVGLFWNKFNYRRMKTWGMNRLTLGCIYIDWNF